ncbi:putative acetyltransferase protein [Cronobacter malonaticus 681]|nr:putative acetyltransferase protein [Cronobacter malonaticus 681]
MKLGIYGAGGLGREVLMLARAINQCTSRWNEIFFIDDVTDAQEVYGAAVVRFDARPAECALGYRHWRTGAAPASGAKARRQRAACDAYSPQCRCSVAKRDPHRCNPLRWRFHFLRCDDWQKRTDPAARLRRSRLRNRGK